MSPAGQDPGRLTTPARDTEDPPAAGLGGDQDPAGQRLRAPHGPERELQVQAVAAQRIGHELVPQVRPGRVEPIGYLVLAGTDPVQDSHRSSYFVNDHSSGFTNSNGLC